MAILCLRFDLRAPEFGAPAGDLYRACLDMAEWGDKNGLDMVVLSEHHGAEDGYLPAPLTMAAAVAGRTRRIGINIAALLVPLYDPIRLAEQLAVLDLASGGRVSIVAGAGYRYEEFEMAGIDRKQRGKILEENIRVMQQAWTGEPFEWRGRKVVVTPRPLTRPHPMIMIGGSTEIAARRAARLRLPLFPSAADPQLLKWYRDECKAQGWDGGFAALPSGPGGIFVADDVDATWEIVGPHVLHEAQVYAAWQTPGQSSHVHIEAQTVDDVRASDVYQVLTPDECVKLAESEGPTGSLVFHPLIGGLDPEFGWASLRLFAAEVLPQLGR